MDSEPVAGDKRPRRKRALLDTQDDAHREQDPEHNDLLGNGTAGGEVHKRKAKKKARQANDQTVMDIIDLTFTEDDDEEDDFNDAADEDNDENLGIDPEQPESQYENDQGDQNAASEHDIDNDRSPNAQINANGDSQEWNQEEELDPGPSIQHPLAADEGTINMNSPQFEVALPEQPLLGNHNVSDYPGAGNTSAGNYNVHVDQGQFHPHSLSPPVHLSMANNNGHQFGQQIPQLDAALHRQLLDAAIQFKAARAAFVSATAAATVAAATAETAAAVVEAALAAMGSASNQF